MSHSAKFNETPWSEMVYVKYMYRWPSRPAHGFTFWVYAATPIHKCSSARCLPPSVSTDPYTRVVRSARPSSRAARIGCWSMDILGRKCSDVTSSPPTPSSALVFALMDNLPVGIIRVFNINYSAVGHIMYFASKEVVCLPCRFLLDILLRNSKITTRNLR